MQYTDKHKLVQANYLIQLFTRAKKFAGEFVRGTGHHYLLVLHSSLPAEKFHPCDTFFRGTQLCFHRIQSFYQPAECAFCPFDGGGIGETDPFATKRREERAGDNGNAMILS